MYQLFYCRTYALLICLFLFRSGPTIQFARADIGMASQYVPPYTPTACYGDDRSQFPTSNLFAAAGEGTWDGGAACGRQYLVRCINGPKRGSCKPDFQTIRVRVVDRAQTSVSRPTKEVTSLVLSNTAYMTIADPSVPFVNIEFWYCFASKEQLTIPF
ncbi:hypothetical protein ACJIZ3_004973 [Penstemon smallii]|uniref:Expansin-like EG45 domain-containing protein n=1 Tax=Penstemon smallii TaxID=265156 RepID=A0ABD3S3K4_9LAMI